MTISPVNYNNYGYYNHNDGNYTYVPRSQASEELGYILATVAPMIIAKALPSFSNPFLKQMTKEHANNHKYKDAFFNAIKKSGLEKNGLKFVNVTSPLIDKSIAAGLNACYVPDKKTVMLNSSKATITGFHELGHAQNHLQSKLGKFLQSFRKPGYVTAGLMGTVALFSRRKPKEDESGIWNFIQNNCGKIAFAAMLPTVAEEALASHKGIKLAEKAGLEKPLVQNLKKFYGKALLSYVGYAIVAGLSVFAASKITEYFTRPKKVPVEDLNNFFVQ